MKHHFESIYIICVLLKYLALSRINAEECNDMKEKFLSYKSYLESNSTQMVFSNYNTFTELNIECIRTYNITNVVTFVPRKSCILTKSFRIENVFDNRRIKSSNYIHLLHLNGIEIREKEAHIVKLSNYVEQKFLVIYFSKLNFIINEVPINTNICDLRTFNDSNNSINSFYGVCFTKVKYPKSICPFIFKGSKTVEILFTDITNSFLTRNQLDFYESNQSNNADILMKLLKAVSFSLNYETFSGKILSKNAFVNIKELIIEGILNRIQIDVFKEFKSLKSIHFQINNLKEFIHLDNKWMQYLNYYVFADLRNTTSVQENIHKFMRVGIQCSTSRSTFNPIYEYPDEDICLFKDFPHSRLVVPILVSGEKLKCTCTLKWLQSYVYMYKSFLNFSYDYGINYQQQLVSTLTKTYKYCNNSLPFDCDFEKRFNNCKVNSIITNTSIFIGLNDIDVFFLVKWLQFILLIILQPILCVLGLINNILTILVIRNNSSKKEFKHSMYLFIQINSYCNIIYCIITGLKLINTCLFYASSLFCSKVYQAHSSQYFKIIVVQFLGNAAKISCNIFYLSFSFNRVILITFNKRKVTARKNTLIKLYILIILFVSLILSAFKLFQYKINNQIDFRKEDPYELRDEYFCQDDANKFECTLFNWFKISNNVLNDIMCVILNTIFDVILLKNFHKNMKKKSLHIVDLNQHTNIQKSKKNVNRMILCNSIMYSISHLPEFITSILLLIFAKQVSRFCNFYVSCDLINEEAEFFSLVSMVFQFYIFIIFDRNFKESFNTLKTKIRSFLFCAVNTKKIKTNIVENAQTLYLINLKNLIETD